MLPNEQQEMLCGVLKHTRWNTTGERLSGTVREQSESFGASAQYTYFLISYIVAAGNCMEVSNSDDDRFFQEMINHCIDDADICEDTNDQEVSPIVKEFEDKVEFNNNRAEVPFPWILKRKEKLDWV